MDSQDRQAEISERIRALLAGQPFAVLCTQGQGQPYGSLIAYAIGPDLDSAAFVTPRATTKYRLLCACAAVALVIDSRSRFPGDLDQIEAVTATGRAVELAPGPDLDRWAGLLTERHPELAGFVHDPSNALFRIDVDRYVHVSHLQQVHQWMPKADE